MKTLFYERSALGIHRLWLASGFCFGIGPLTACETPWYDLGKYAWFMRYQTEDPKGSGWQVRFLWIYFGRFTPDYRTVKEPQQ